MSKWKSVLAILLLSVVLAPRASEAGLGEVIWGLSGPQLLGVGFGCRFSFADGHRQCQAGSPPTVPLRAAELQPKLKPFFSLGGSYFRSTGKDSDTATYKLGEVEMLAFEPAVSFSTAPRMPSNWRFYHGGRISVHFFFGPKFFAV